MSARYQERVGHIEKLLLIDNLNIDTNELRRACAYGIPDNLRPLCWRLFLDYLPRDRHSWTNVLQKQRSYYENLVENLIIHPSSFLSAENADDSSNNFVVEKEVNDHPLAISSPLHSYSSSHNGKIEKPSDPANYKHSEWANYFKDNETLLQIDKDVRRLRPEMGFFQRKAQYSKKWSTFGNLAKRVQFDNLSVDVPELKFYTKSFIKLDETPNNNSENDCLCQNSDEGEMHWQVVERLLFIYSKLNPGIKYVQGMNEIIGPIYFVFASDPDEEWAMHAEADVFYCFQNLMSEIKDNFIRTLDNSDCGIEAVLNRFYGRFHNLDLELYVYLAEKLAIKPQFYAFRWISLLLSQEFSLPDLIEIWDNVFSSMNRIESVEFICLAMIESIRKELLTGDFGHNVRLLQNYPGIDISQLIAYSMDLKQGNKCTGANIINWDSDNNSVKSNRNGGSSFTQTLSAKSQNLKLKLSSFVANTQQKVFSKYTNATTSSFIEQLKDNTLDRRESSTKKENRYKWEKVTASSISHQSTEKEKKNRSKFVFHINLNRFQKDISDKKLSNKLDQKSSKKKVSFLWGNSRRKSTIGSGGPTYDYIDAENSSIDPVYSRVDENPVNLNRYDYPSFLSYGPRQNESFYTSASQIYSAASDDPYSSIMSEADNGRGSGAGVAYDIESNSNVYDVGYEKVVNRLHAQKSASKAIKRNTLNTSQTSKNVDALYAKINKPARNNALDLNNINHLSQLSENKELLLPSTSVVNNKENNASIYQLEESGSGSVGSCYSSKNPSYRYLTVRESVDIIRERIRRQEIENNNFDQRLMEENLFPASSREHYYSTIANEYESVGGEDSFVMTENNQQSVADSSRESQNQQKFYAHLSNSLTASFSMLTDRFHHNNLMPHSNKIHAFDSESECAPKPPTSPIPNRSLEELRAIPIVRPVILSPLRTPISDLISLNIRNGTGSYQPQASAYSFSSNAASKLSKNEENIRLINGTTPSPSPSIVLPRILVVNSNRTKGQNEQQRYSYSFDPSSKFYAAENNNRQNRTSAPAFAIERFRLETVLSNPPPLPPLPTPSNDILNIAFLHDDESTINEADVNSESSKNFQKLQKSYSVVSRIPISLSKGVTRSRTPSPTVEIGTQTTGVVSVLKSSFWSKPILKTSNKVLNDHNSGCRSQKLSSPPAPVGSDYISTMDLSNERSWPLSPASLQNSIHSTLENNDPTENGGSIDSNKRK